MTPVRTVEVKVAKHPLEKEYGLSAYELLDALSKRFRARVTLEGAVAEVQMEKKIQGPCRVR